jgi:hypothetical protein
MMNINMGNLPLFMEPRKREFNYKIYAYEDFGSPKAPTICSWPSCGERGGWNGTPLCAQHANDVWAIVDETQPQGFKDALRDQRIAFLRQMEQEEERERAKRTSASTDNATRPGYIYYLRVGDLIKIGYTLYLEDRMKAYPPNSELLATHPGTRQTERQMHHRFLHLLKQGREWFIEGDDLMAHIEDVSSKFPLEKGYKFKQAVRLAS